METGHRSRDFLRPHDSISPNRYCQPKLCRLAFGAPLREKYALYRVGHLATSDFVIDSLDGCFLALTHAATLLARNYKPYGLDARNVTKTNGLFIEGL